MPDATVGASPDAGSVAADLATFCCLDELGLVVINQRLRPERALLACRVVEPETLTSGGVVAAAARAPNGTLPRGSRGCAFNIVWSQVEAGSDAVAAAAQRHGLVLYGPQHDVVVPSGGSLDLPPDNWWEAGPEAAPRPRKRWWRRG